MALHRIDTNIVIGQWTTICLTWAVVDMMKTSWNLPITVDDVVIATIVMKPLPLLLELESLEACSFHGVVETSAIEKLVVHRAAVSWTQYLAADHRTAVDDSTMALVLGLVLVLEDLGGLLPILKEDLDQDAVGSRARVTCGPVPGARKSRYMALNWKIYEETLLTN